VFAAPVRLLEWFGEYPSIRFSFRSAGNIKRFRESRIPLREAMQWLLRVVCIGYIVFLTLLLLTSEPSRLIGVRGNLPWALQKMMPAAHAISFLVLAVLALTPRWPLPRWSIVLILAAYGGMTEIVQGFVPHRTPDWMDWAQDLGGIAAGVAICWGGATMFRLATQSPQRLTAESSNDGAPSPTPEFHPPLEDRS
jgi:hypothetical protein